MARWFIGDNNKNEQGPYSALRLKEMALTGEIDLDDPVRREDMPSAKPAEDIFRLIPLWYTLRLGDQSGPHDADALKELIAAHAITEDDLLRRFEWAEWRAAPEINGIMQLVCPLQATFMTIEGEDHLEADTVWYALKMSKKQGPFTTDQMLRFVQHGDIRPDDLVNHPEGAPDWQPARALPFFDEDALLATFYSKEVMDRCRQEAADYEAQAPSISEAIGLDHEAEVTCLAFSYGGNLLASGGWDNAVYLWDVASRSKVACLTGHSGMISSVAFSPDDKYVASSSRDGTIRVWGVKTREECACLHGHTGPVNVTVFLPDGKTLVSGGDDNTVRIWNVETGEEQNCIEANVRVHHLRINPAESHLLVATSGELIVWDLETEKVERDKRIVGVRCLAVSDLGSVVAVIMQDCDNLGEIKKKDEEQGITHFDDIDLHGAMYVWNQSSEKKWFRFVGHRDEIWSVAFLSDSDILASASADGTAKLWEVKSDGMDLICTFRGHLGSVYGVAFSPDGHWLATAGEDGTVRLWDLSAVLE